MSIAAPDVQVVDIEHIRDLQLRIPGMDGYRSERIAIAFGGGVELDTSSEDDIALLESLRMGKDITLTVTATVTGKTFALYGSENEKAGYRVGLKVHSFEVAG